jgi:hypothetical protein
MRRSTPVLVVVTILGVMILAPGCGSPAPDVVKDPQFARDVLDAVYAGSLAPLKDSLDPVFAHAMTDQTTAATGTLLTDQFGAVKDVQFQSMQEANPAVIEAVWAVAADGSDFEMMLWVHQGKLSGIWFRPSPDTEWGPVPQIGLEYTRHQRMPAGW